MTESAPDQASAVHHDAARSRFTITVDGVEAVLDYHRDGNRMVITHTGVPDAIGGRGIAGQLTRTAFETAREQGWRVQPACSYAAAWAHRHPEYSALLA